MTTGRAALETTNEVFARMRVDHRVVLDGTAAMLSSAEAIAGGTRRRAAAEAALRKAVAHLVRQFATHMGAEDDVIYPAVERALPSSRERLEPLRAEHEELRNMLSELRRTLGRPAAAVRDEQIAVQTQDLVDLLRIHIRKEEAIVFTLAEQLIPQDRLGALVRRLQHRAPRPPASPRAPTKPNPNRAPKAATPRRARTKPKGRTR